MSRELEFNSFEEFYPFYISQHSKPATRVIHAAGTAAAAAVLLKALAVGPRKQALLAPVIGYGSAWFAHFVIEKNKPATFGYPLYSFIGDYKMIFDMATGKNAQLQQMADDYLAMLDAQELAAEAAQAIIDEHPAHTDSPAQHPHTAVEFAAEEPASSLFAPTSETAEQAEPVAANGSSPYTS